MNKLLLSYSFDQLTFILIAVFFIGFIALIAYKSQSPSFHKGNPFIQGGIKNPKVRFIFLLIAIIVSTITLCFASVAVYKQIKNSNKQTPVFVEWFYPNLTDKEAFIMTILNMGGSYIQNSKDESSRVYLPEEYKDKLYYFPHGIRDENGEIWIWVLFDKVNEVLIVGNNNNKPKVKSIVDNKILENLSKEKKFWEILKQN